MIRIQFTKILSKCSSINFIYDIVTSSKYFSKVVKKYDSLYLRAKDCSYVMSRYILEVKVIQARR